MNKKLVALLAFILLATIVFTIIINNKPKEEEIDTTQFLKLITRIGDPSFQGCTSQTKKDCEVILEKVKLGREAVDLRHEILTFEQIPIEYKLYLDETLILDVSSDHFDMTYEIISDMLFVKHESLSELSLYVFNNRGGELLKYEKKINRLPFISYDIREEKLILYTSEQYRNLDPCDPEFYSKSGIGAFEYLSTAYEIDYLGNNNFAKINTGEKLKAQDYVKANCTE